MKGEVKRLMEKHDRLAANIAIVLKQMVGQKVTYQKGAMKPAEGIVKEADFTSEKGVSILVHNPVTGKEYKLKNINDIS